MLPSISAVIITKNESQKIEDCIKSLTWLDEVLVVDDFSSDGTPDKATACGAHVIPHVFTGFRDQKKFAVDQSRNDWVLEIDADERVSEEMKAAIQSLTAEDYSKYGGFAFRRLTRFWGRWIRYGSLYPDYKVRLYNRKQGEWSAGNVHERFIPQRQTKEIPVDILHEQDLNFKQYIERTARYAELSAIDYALAGKKWHWLDFLRPVHTFVYRFFIRRGFLDGLHGFLIAVVGAMGTFMKYAYLMEHTLKKDLKVGQ